MTRRKNLTPTPPEYMPDEDETDIVDFLISEYAAEDDRKLTKDAQSLKRRLLRILRTNGFVPEREGVEKGFRMAASLTSDWDRSIVGPTHRFEDILLFKCGYIGKKQLRKRPVNQAGEPCVYYVVQHRKKTGKDRTWTTSNTDNIASAAKGRRLHRGLWELRSRMDHALRDAAHQCWAVTGSHGFFDRKLAEEALRRVRLDAKRKRHDGSGMGGPDYDYSDHEFRLAGVMYLRREFGVWEG